MKNILKCIGWSILYFSINFIVQFGFIIFSISNGIESEEILNQIAINNNLLLMICSNIIVIMIFFIIWNIKKKKIKKVQDNNVNKKNYFFLILIAFLYSILFLIITYSLSFKGADDMITSMNYFNSKNHFLGFILYASSLLIFSPIVEELLCRGIMINELNKKFSKKQSIIISSCIFGIMHFMTGGVVLVIGAIIMGIILGYVYNNTKSLCRTIFVHCVANFSDIIFLFIVKLSDKFTIFSILITISLIFVLLLYFKNIESKD